jgi:O-antigen/teichoic acid export membrane protein
MLETHGSVVLGRTQRASRKAYRALLTKILLVGFAAWLAGFLLILVFGERLTMVLYGPEYARYWYLLLGFWIVNLWILLFKIGSIRLRIQSRTREIFTSYMVGVISVFIAVAIGTMYAGVVGAVVGYATGGAALVIFLLRFRNRGFIESANRT